MALTVLVVGGFFTIRWVGSVLGTQSTPIGWVDMQRALAGHPKYPSVEAALRTYAQAQLADARTRMNTMTPIQSHDLARQVNRTITAKRAQLYGGLVNDVRAALREVAARQDIGVVLQWNAVLYGGVDLTDSVIKVLASPDGGEAARSPIGIGRMWALLAFAASAPLNGGRPSVGVVDSQRVMNESVKALQYEKQLNDCETQVAAELSALQGQVSPAELNARRASYADDLSHMSFNLTTKFNSLLRQVAGQVARREGLGLIVV